MYGDSKIVVDWLNQHIPSHNITLRPYNEHIKRALTHFKSYSIKQIYCERNTMVDSLLEQVLMMDQVGASLWLVDKDPGPLLVQDRP